MSRRRTNIAAGIVVLGVAAGGVVAASAQEGGSKPEAAEGPSPQGLTADQREAIEAVRTDSPIPVQDAAGTIRGTVRDSALTARDARVSERMVQGFRERRDGIDEEYDQLFEALRILDPVPVVDEKGATVGWWTRNFKERAELEVLVPEARATIARLLPDGASS